MLEALIFTVTAACVLWVSEMFMLAKNGWTVSRSTPICNLLQARGDTFCTIFWGVGMAYFILSVLTFLASFVITYLVTGITYLAQGTVSKQGTMVVALATIAIMITTAYAVKEVGCKLFDTAVTESEKFTAHSKRISAMKELYKVFKEKYCPIIK